VAVAQAITAVSVNAGNGPQLLSDLARVDADALTAMVSARPMKRMPPASIGHDPS
jgi:hypothetical protein